MSRIFEALQRADRERKANPIALDEQFAETAFLPGIDKQPAPSEEAILEDIPCYSWRPFIPSLPTLADRGEGVEQFRSLRSRVYKARDEAPLKSILVSSGMPSEGKTFIAANLAMSLARNSESSVLLIDGDLRRPALHKLLGAPNVPGLSEYLAGTADLKTILQCDRSSPTNNSKRVGSIRNLTFIPSGNCGDNSAELVANPRMEELITTLSPYFDWIVIDSSPVLAVTDAVELSRVTGAVLLVARGARTPFDVAQRTQAAFSNSRILGFVLNDVKEVPRRGYNYYDYYRGPDADAHPSEE